ncbi:uncharacterized protein LOC6607544 [Drosophila sechellia]|uniref:GM23586 n=1 Tax=Drosophila sechellia TaxID=7238 RepID=B4HFC1_DROSE|nr:uncharacterized protein LOC6607544 [Drosophila sechellia]EDW43299.1 GM23586 [Drosophila sechellia]
MIAKLRKIYPSGKAVRHSPAPCSTTDLNDAEKDSNVKKRRAEYLVERMQRLLLFLTVFLLFPVVIFVIFKFLIMETLYGNSDDNVGIGSGVATVIVMHVLVTAYILRLIFVQEISSMEKLEWEVLVPPNTQFHGSVFIVLLLMSYCCLIIGFPIATFFALKFVVLKSYAHINADIISAICTVVAVHAAVGFYIYRAIYAKSATAKSAKISL